VCVGLTVIFQIINDENSDFSLAGYAIQLVTISDLCLASMGRVLSLLVGWRREHLRFVLVYDAGVFDVM
jgi:hypothetical protein